MSEGALTAREARRELYDIMRGDASFEKKARDALEVGKQYLGADNGHLTRIDADTDHWEALVSTDPSDGQFPPGLELDLETTYCRRVIADDSAIALHDAPAQGWADDPAFEEHGLHCYHGTSLWLDDEPYGTVCFVAEYPRSEGFSDDETMFAELITRLLERELEREQHETELTRRTNLVNVLNRVLRHNLRNDMAVIRGRVQTMGDPDTDDTHRDIVLRKIDQLIELSEQARELEQVVSQEFDRQQTDIVVLIDDIVETVASEYPSASFTVTHDEEVTAAVLPSFEQAVEELLENAAKHGGEAPTVTVTVENAPNTAEIHITDDGPGLSKQERKVLDAGIETPLIHGSGLGLWLVHWIVTSHEGTIEATPSDDGTTMRISIPRSPETDAHTEAAELRRARDQYQAAFQEAFDAMLIIDDETRIVDANPEATSIYGMEREELLGRSIRGFLPRDFNFESAWAEFQQAGRDRDTVTVTGADGVERPVEYAATADIVPGLHLVISRDITDRIRHENRLRMQSQAMDEAPVGITITDPDQADNPLVYVNDAFVELTGYEKDEVIGRNCRFLQGEDTRSEPVYELREAIENHEAASVTLRNYRKDGTMFWNRVTIAPIEDENENVTNYIGFQEAITDLVDREHPNSTDQEESG